MKKWTNLIIGILVLVLVVSFTKDLAIRISVEKGVEAVTGLRLKLQGLSVGIIRTMVDVKGLKLYNPTGFKDRVMIDIPRIYVDYDLPAIIKGNIHLPEVILEMTEFTVVKNESGVLNLDSLNVVKEEKAKKEPAAAEKKPMPGISIDKLVLKIGKVVYKDYSKGGEPQVQEFVIGLDETYSNIDDPNALVSLIVVKALAKTSIARLANFDVSGLNKQASEVLSSATKTLSSATDMMMKTGSGTGTAVQETAKQAATGVQEAAKDAAETVKNILPFGKK